MNLKISYKLALGFGLIITLTLLSGLFALGRLDSVARLTATVTEHDYKATAILARLQQSQDRMKLLREKEMANLFLVLSGKSTNRDDNIRKDWRMARQQTEGLLDDLRREAKRNFDILLSPQRRDQWQLLVDEADIASSLLSDLAVDVEHEFSLADSGQIDAMLGRSGTLAQQRDAFDASVGKTRETVDRLVVLGEELILANSEKARIAIIVGLVLIIIAALVISVLIHRSINRRIAGLGRFVDVVGKGDLSRRCDIEGEDEMGILGQRMQQMVNGLRQLAEQSREVTSNLTSAVSEIQASTQQQAASASEQAASVQQTTATMQEINQSGKQIISRTKQVTDTAESSRTASKQGLEAVQTSSSSMMQIGEQTQLVAENIVALSEKTQAISDIINLVNDLSEQSNLLALNASIEAVAAGEQGRRFGVVATEVKSLADQSKNSTREIREILEEIQKGINTLVMLTEESVKRVEVGKQQTDKARETIEKLSETTELSLSTFEQILASTNQQQIGIEQTTDALSAIREAADQNVSGTRQLEEAATNINSLGQKLQQATGQYVL